MMRKLFYLVLSVAVLAGCHKDDDDDNAPKPGKDFTETVAGVSFDMVYVAGGTFSMGMSYDDSQYLIHRVTLSDYYIGKFEVTQGLWEKVMGTTLEEQRNRSDNDEDLCGQGSDYPMYYVNWNEAQEFCKKLSELTGRKYALSTEAQWEYAACGGAKSQGFKYSGGNTLDEVAWYKDTSLVDSKRTTHPVGTKQPNELGIYDMSGNVWEWCSDWCGDYSSAAVTDPVGPVTGSHRVIRGGGWRHLAGYCSVKARYFFPPGYRYNFIGFRVVVLP